MFPRIGVFLFLGFGYFGGMTELLDLHARQWNLIVSPSNNRLLLAMAYLAHTTELIVLDCGRKYDPSVIARAARGREEVIDQIKNRRAYICFEVVKLLESTPSGKTSIIVLDFLSTFYDENVKLSTRKFLLETSIRHFQRLSQTAGLAVSVYVPPDAPDSIYLFERLKTAAPHISSYAPVENKTSQLRFF